MTYDFTYLWKYNKITGYWDLIRNSLIENAAKWLAVYSADEPYELFKISKRRPNAKPPGA